MYSELDDKTLVMLTLAGDQSAYEILVARYQYRVTTAAMSLLHSKFMADDAAQDAFIAAWMKLDTLREPEKFGVWVARIAKRCAMNMRVRYSEYMEHFPAVAESDEDTLDLIYSLPDDALSNPEYRYLLSEERALLRERVDSLPEKVRMIISLHYFDGLSIAEIADRMRISEGTVKRQLHDGRKHLRKELCAMDETMNDSFVRRVMKKVEELKLWQYNRQKNGFESVYRDVLRDVEELPESTDKYHAMADVLLRGWWWIPVKQNDELFARLRETAELGKNDEVMAFIAAREDEKLWGNEKLEFMQNKQIPLLEAKGFTVALDREWHWLGRELINQGKTDEGVDALKRAISILPESDAYRALSESILELHKLREVFCAGTEENRISMLAIASELYCDTDAVNKTTPRYWQQYYYDSGVWGYLCHDSTYNIFCNASYCDGHFTLERLSVGESYVGSDGTTLTYTDDSATVETPCGVFDGCQLWTTENIRCTCDTYYKSGVGIVAQCYRDGVIDETRRLCKYNVRGDGLIPCDIGNSWEYTAGYDPEYQRYLSCHKVIWSDGKKTIFGAVIGNARLKYDNGSWLDMMTEIRREYFGRDGKLHDVSEAMSRAHELATTPAQKAHTKSAVSVMRRIFDTNEEFNPTLTSVGLWNFFQYSEVSVRDGRCSIKDNRNWSFEWKSPISYNSIKPVLFNDIYGILFDSTECIWSDEWQAGAKLTYEFFRHDYPVRTELSCESCEPITTKAGSFDDCIKLTLDVSGYKYGLDYRNGKKEYYFAKGIGIVRAVFYWQEGACKCVYELTSYSGVGEGYMPFCENLTRHYDALDLTDGCEAYSDYSYARDNRGNIAIYEDRCGVKNITYRVTDYGSIWDEVVEETLWDNDKHDESRMRHDINNLKLLLHYLGRPARYWARPDKAVAWHEYRLRMLEMLSPDGEIPRAFLGLYVSIKFRNACALFGTGEKERAYQNLDESLELAPEWLKIPDGEPLEVGDELIFGGVKLIHGKGIIELPDGSREPLDDWSVLDTICTRDLFYRGLTSPHGWEWFDSVRGEERYKTAVERAKELRDREW